MRKLYQCVHRYRGQYRVRRFSCLDQFLCMAFAQLTYRESLRDIETCLRALQPKLYHAGIRAKISRSTLADANERRDWRIYADFAQVLIARARHLYAGDDFGVDLAHTAYVFDATTIDLCLTLFPWARFRQRKAAVKLHTLLDLRGSIPSFIHITEGKTHDVTALDELLVEPGAFYVMDRGYIDFGRLYAIAQSGAFFVVRAKRNLAYARRGSRPVDKTTGLRSDQTIVLTGPKTSQEYPAPLRRISYVDAETGKRFVFLTNNFTLPALTIAQLYKCRWQVELFFKWIKQYLRIKAFYGTSANAVKTQIWIAISIYVLVAILKKELKLDRSLGEILQILSVTLFEREEIYQVLTATDVQTETHALCNQLNLFDL
ncbi:MAG: transposase [candidate division NC10 bacterium RIFCSPLOWO2_12_FULL_66_18]|nr:MAG: transposase [candidate division NC10 bacterium RIFCSPLOWO2_12_FULL_66_18]